MDAEYYAGLYDWRDDESFDDYPFKTDCKWCGKRITMTPTDDGWKPMFRNKIHTCDERRKDLLNLMPDETKP